MGESSSHISLVEQLAEWIASTILSGDKGMLLIDHPASSSYQRPPKIAQYIPDVYVAASARNPLVIGEAKTRRDMERRHTIDQLSAFLGYCERHSPSHLVLAVPWDYVRLSRSILAELAKSAGSTNTKVTVIDMLIG